jgi:phosphatidylserine decarboxylase
MIFAVYWYLHKVWFYRDPKRLPPSQPGIIVSPADGQVIYKKKVVDGKVISEKLGRPIEISEISKEDVKIKEGWLVGVYMSPLDVHFNYAPINGQISRIIHTQAKVNLPMVDFWEYLKLTYLRKAVNLFAKKFHFQNERNTIFLDGDVKLVMVEIADKFVNKINCFVKEGDLVKIGQKVSFIERGSQVDLLILKKDIDFKVKVGQQVYGGKTIIAQY